MGHFMFSIACIVWNNVGQFSLGDLIFKWVLYPVFTYKIDYFFIWVENHVRIDSKNQNQNLKKKRELNGFSHENLDPVLKVWKGKWIDWNQVWG